MCTNAMWMLSVLVFKYIVIIYRFIIYTSHGRIKIDVINGSYKSYLGQKNHGRH